MTTDLESHLRVLCLSFPDVIEKLSHGTPSFFVGRQFAQLWMEGHHDHAFALLWCAAAEGVQRDLVAQNTERFFVPPYVGSRGWIGVRLEGHLDVDELEMLLEDAYRCIATRRQVERLDRAGR